MMPASSEASTTKKKESCLCGTQQVPSRTRASQQQQWQQQWRPRRWSRREEKRE